jgi:Sulfate permease and related transporters (MFS superfamily)
MVDTTKGLRFSLTELSGSLGDFGTIIPLILGVAVVNRLPLAPMLLFIGLWFIIAGVYYGRPVPIEPMKAIAVIAIASGLSADAIAAAGILIGLIFLLLGFGTWMNALEKWIPFSVVRGVQLGLALLLLRTTTTFAVADLVFFGMGVSVVVLFFLLGRCTRIPDLSAIVIVLLAVGAGIILHGIPSFLLITPLHLILPPLSAFPAAFTDLVIPQEFITLTNAILATVLLLKDQFGEEVPARKLSRMIGAMNLISVPLGGFPMCHGAGGLAGQYRFGARTGGADVYAGIILILAAVFFGSNEILGIIPEGFFGALLLFAALELARHGIRTDQYLITGLIAVLALLLGMTWGFLVGIALYYLRAHFSKRLGSCH